MTGRFGRAAGQWIAGRRSAIVFGLCLLAGWEVASRYGGFRPNVFPSPSAVLSSLDVRRDLIFQHAWLTFYQTVLGLMIAVVAGMALGWIIAKSRRLYAALYPLIVVLQVLPKEALAPLVVLWFGAGILSRLILVCLISFFPMVINTMTGIRGLDENMRRYAASLSCPPWQLFRKIEIPAALPAIFSGLKISATLAVVGVVVAEIVAGRDGLGYLLLFASSRLDMSFSLAILLVLAAWGGALFGIIELAARQTLYWK